MQNTTQEEKPSQEDLLGFPNSMKNASHVRNAVKHNDIGYNHVRAIDWKEGFDWLQDPETICGEWFNGTHVVLQGFASPEFGAVIHTKKSCLSPVDYPTAWYNVSKGYRDGRFDRNKDDRLPGTIIKVTNHNWSHPDDPTSDYFVSRREQLKQFSSQLWPDGPRTLDSTQLFLYEDIQTGLPGKRKIISGPVGMNHKIFKGEKDEDGGHMKSAAYHRPDGLLFYNPKFETFGRIRLQDCTWWQLQHVAKFDTAKERWDSVELELTRLRENVGS